MEFSKCLSAKIPKIFAAVESTIGSAVDNSDWGKFLCFFKYEPVEPPFQGGVFVI
jgi:hypothetical protein